MTEQVVPVQIDEHLETIGRLAVGQADAFSSLYANLAPRALRLATRITRDRSEAEDVVHDAFLEIWRRAAEYSAAKATVAGWALMIVRSRAIRPSPSPNG